MRTAQTAGARFRLPAKPFAWVAAALLLLGSWTALHAADDESMADRSLRRIVDRQKAILAEAARQGDKVDEPTLRAQVQALTHEYELLLRDNPKFAAGYAAYGYLLGKVDMRKEAAAMLLKANQYDPDIPLVKNQLGNFMAEEGKPLQAAPYYIAAIKLAPNEPLYHYQLGSLLTEARDEFLKSGEWTRETLDAAMFNAFKRAAELAPERIEFAYRQAESFYDLEKPDWNAALKAWSVLEEKATTAIERQTMRLHAANICVKLGKPDHAQALLKTVDEEKLQGQKQKILRDLEAAGKK